MTALAGSDGGDPMPRPEKDSDDTRSRSADRGSRWPDDQFLRKHGFRIRERPDVWTAIWERQGREYTFYQAMQAAEWEEENKA
jgi:hypothetical protein